MHLERVKERGDSVRFARECCERETEREREKILVRQS
jgi:hypothetical protein